MIIGSHHIYVPAAGRKDYKALKDIGGVWSARRHSFRFPKSVHALDEIAAFLPDIAATDAFQVARSNLLVSREALRKLKEKPADTTHAEEKLRTYQRQDVQYLSAIPSAGVFNQPRTGKTPTMIEVIRVRRTKRNIIVCPASLQENWRREIVKWHDEAEVYACIGTPKQRKQEIEDFRKHSETAPCYLIVSKDTIKRQINDFLFEHDVLVVDEAHFLRNRDTAQSTALVSLGYEAKHRYALTGTPTVKHPADIFGILEFLYPDKFPSYWQFVERYFHIEDNGFGKEIGHPIRHREAELKDIIDAMSTQRLRKDIMQWLPDKQRHRHLCRMDKKQTAVYQQMAQDFFAETEDGAELDAQNILTQLIRLRQITADPKLVGLNAPSAKTDALLEIIQDNLYTANGEPIVIMSMFTGYLKYLKPLIEQLGKRVAMIHGEMDNYSKDKAAQDFQAGKIDVLLCNIISAGTGFTLDKGEVIIFADKAWNPSDNEQAEDRITPTQQDQVHKHFIVSLVCENTIDVHIENVLDRKENLTSIINQCKSVDQLRVFLL